MGLRQFEGIYKSDLHVVEQAKEHPSMWVTVKKVMAYRDNTQVGDIMKGRRPKDTIQILAKYRYGTMTDKGWYTWADLYLFNVKKVTCSDTDYTFFYRKGE